MDIYYVWMKYGMLISICLNTFGILNTRVRRFKNKTGRANHVRLTRINYFFYIESEYISWALSLQLYDA